MKKENWEYEAPVVEVIEVEVEKGFANALISKVFFIIYAR